MAHKFAEIMFTDGVKGAQEQLGSRDRMESFADRAGPNDTLTDAEAQFIEQRDSFYLATVNEDGWPDLYVLSMQGHDEYYENVGGKRFVKKSREIFPR